VLNGAVRQAHYDISGFGSYLRTAAENSFSATTWKVSANWEPVDWLRLRATQSRDIRAPNFAELFLASASSFAPVTNPFVLTPAGRAHDQLPDHGHRRLADAAAGEGRHDHRGHRVQPGAISSTGSASRSTPTASR
jgi:hypothetical protein